VNNWFLTAGELAYWLEEVKKLKKQIHDEEGSTT